MSNDEHTPNEAVPSLPEPPVQAPPPPPSTTEGVVDPVRRGQTWGMACHLAALAGFLGFPFGSLLGPLVVWLATRDRYTFADDQGKEALNFQLSILLYTLACVPLICLFCLGLALMGLLQVFNVVMVLVATFRASEGVPYRYPMTIRFLK